MLTSQERNLTGNSPFTELKGALADAPGGRLRYRLQTQACLSLTSARELMLIALLPLVFVSNVWTYRKVDVQPPVSLPGVALLLWNLSFAFL